MTPAPFRNHQNYNINVYPLVVFIYRGHELGFGRIIRPLLYLLQLRGKIDKQRQCGNASLGFPRNFGPDLLPSFSNSNELRQPKTCIP